MCIHIFSVRVEFLTRYFKILVLTPVGFFTFVQNDRLTAGAFEYAQEVGDISPTSAPFLHRISNLLCPNDNIVDINFHVRSACKQLAYG